MCPKPRSLFPEMYKQQYPSMSESNQYMLSWWSPFQVLQHLNFRKKLYVRSLSPPCAAPLAISGLSPSSVCLIENSIQLTSNMYWVPSCWQQSRKSHRGYKISIKYSLSLQKVCHTIGTNTENQERPTWDRIHFLIRMCCSDIKCIQCCRGGLLGKGQPCQSIKAS